MKKFNSQPQVRYKEEKSNRRNKEEAKKKFHSSSENAVC
jgi:hypothetical protein